MKTSFVVVAAFTALASAQLPNLPACVQSCLLTAVSSDGCGLTDFACHCKNTGLISQVTPCTSKCSCADQTSGGSAIVSLCQSAGVPIQIPAQASCGAGSSSAAPATSSAAAASSAASSAASAASSAVASASSAAASAKSSASAAASSAAASASSAAASASGASSKPSAPSYSAAAGPKATQAAGLIGAAAIAMLAL